MISFLIMLLAVAMLFYVAMIYTSQAVLLLAFSAAVLLVCSLVYVVVVRMLLLGKVIVPIAVSDAGKPVTVQVMIRNRAPMPLYRAKLALEVENSFERKRTLQWHRTSKLLPGENLIELSLTMGQPGNYEIRLRRIRIYGLLGLVSLTRRFPSGKNIQVLPALAEVPVVLTHSVRNYYGDSDIYDEEKAGHDNSEIFQIRPYMEGDKLQSIHWKLSAKADELMVKESSLPKACPVVLLLDYRSPKSGKGSTFGVFLEIGASLSFSLMDAGCAHYMAWYEEQAGDITRIRVDDEESFYFFLSCYLKEQGRKIPGNLKARYDEKYRAEHYLYFLRLTEGLELYKNDERIERLAQESYREKLGGLEIVL